MNVNETQFTSSSSSSNTGFRVESGAAQSAFVEKLGNFRSGWRAELIRTFDDVFANFETHEADIVDAQSAEVNHTQTQCFFKNVFKVTLPPKSRPSPQIPTPLRESLYSTFQEYKGKFQGSVLYGHIRSAINIPSELVFDWHKHEWLSNESLSNLFRDKGLTPLKPLIIYDGTSARSAMLWVAAERVRHFRGNASVYFGSWPEWIIRAPDYLKVIPNSESNNALI